MNSIFRAVFFRCMTTGRQIAGILAYCLLSLATSSQANAQTLYWDSNGDVIGAGTTPTGIWGTDSFWNATSTGDVTTTGAWVSGNAAVFSAGSDATSTFVVTTGAPIIASSILVEEGIVQHDATVAANSLTTSGLTVNSGATFSVRLASSFVATAGSIATLNGGTLDNRNTGVGSSFLTTTAANNNMGIVLGTGGGRLSVSGGTAAISIYTGLISGTGPLYIEGNGIFRLAGPTVATYSGDTIVNGRLQISTNPNVLPAGTNMIINTGGSFDIQVAQTVASLSGGGNLRGNGNGILTITGASSTIYSGIWTDGRIVVNKSGNTGTLTLTGVNTSNRSFTLTNGTVIVEPTASLGGDIMDLNVNGGTLTLMQAAETIENLAGTGGTVNLDNAALILISDPIASTSYSGTIAGAGGLARRNASTTTRTLTLTGNNSYSGNTIIDKGIISVGSVTALGGTAGYTQVTATGAELLFNGATINFTVSEPLRIAGTGASNSGAISVIAGATPTISGPVTLIGNATIAVSSASSIALTNANAVVSSANENLTLQGGSGTAPFGIGTISGVIALGTGSLTKLQGGTWILSGTNTYDGLTDILAGALNIQNSSALGSTVAGTLVSGSGSLQIQGGGVLVPIGETLLLNSTSTSALRNISGDNEYAGPITLGANSFIVSNLNKLTVSNPNSITGTFNLTLGGVGDVDVAGVIATSTGTLTKTGTGTVTLLGINSYTGNTIVSAGTLVVNGSTDVGSVVSVNGGTLAGTGTVAGTVNVGTGGTIRGDSGTGTAPLNVGATTITGSAGSTGATLATYLVTTAGLPTANSTLALAGNSLTFTNPAVGDKFNILLLNDGSLADGPHSIILATGLSNTITTLTVADFTVVSGSGNITYSDYTLSTTVGNTLRLDFTSAAVPEPGTILGLAAAGMGLAGWIRRRRTI